MIIGIDIGTSYSSVAILKDGKAKEIKPPTENSASIPSAVFVKDDGTLLIGRPAVVTRMRDPSCFKDNFKRNFGTDKPYLLGDKELTPDEIYVAYFKSFKESVKSFTGKDVTKAYITHPVGYSQKKKKLLEQAARFTGLNNIELLDEPTAAALSYFSDHMPRSGETLLVYDLGGGTFDLTLVEMTENGFRLLTDPVGDSRLGGVDFDQILDEDIIAEFSKEHDLTEALENDRFRFQIREAAVNAKINLSSDTSALVSVPYGFGEFLEYKITREHFNKLIESKVRHSCTLIEKIAKNAGLTPAQIDKVLCVGGSTRIPFVTMCVEETVCKPALRTADPELAICLGAVLKEVVKIKPQGAIDEIAEVSESDNLNEMQDNKTAMTIAFEKAEKEKLKAEEKKENKQGSKQPTPKPAPKSPQELYEKGLEYANTNNDSEAVKWYLEAAHQGFAPAQYELGFCYQNGRGVKKDDNEAKQWFRKAADQNHSGAQFHLGCLYEIVYKDNKSALKWYKKAAEQGHASANLYLTNMYAKGCGVPQNDSTGKKWRDKAANAASDSSEEYRLNRENIVQDNGISEDEQNNRHEVMSHAEEIYNEAAAHEAEEYFDEAIELYRKAAEQGHVDAHLRIADMYAKGRGVTQNDSTAEEWYEKAAKCCRNAAEQGDAYAQNLLGLLYKGGIGIEQNYTQAVRWFRLSANQGRAEAQNDLGNMYSQGLGVTQNESEAVRFFLMAAEQGHDAGQFNLGFRYQHGFGVPQDYDEAVKWFHRSADQGYIDAKRALYVMGAADKSMWKNISSADEAENYALALVEKLDLKVLLGYRHDMPLGGGFSDEFYRRLPGALSYAKLSHNEFPIYIFDYTMLGWSAKNGILATTKAIHFAWSTEDGKKCFWRQIASFDRDIRHRFKTKSGEEYAFPSSNNNYERQIKLLHQMWQDLR